MVKDECVALLDTCVSIKRKFSAGVDPEKGGGSKTKMKKIK